MSFAFVLWTRETSFGSLPENSIATLLFYFPSQLSFFLFLYLHTACLWNNMCISLAIGTHLWYSFFLIPLVCILCIQKAKCSCFLCKYIMDILMLILVLSEWGCNWISSLSPTNPISLSKHSFLPVVLVVSWTTSYNDFFFLVFCFMTYQFLMLFFPFCCLWKKILREAITYFPFEFPLQFFNETLKSFVLNLELHKFTFFLSKYKQNTTRLTNIITTFSLFCMYLWINKYTQLISYKMLIFF